MHGVGDRAGNKEEIRESWRGGKEHTQAVKIEKRIVQSL
jgi:hypothetical protein